MSNVKEDDFIEIIDEDWIKKMLQEDIYWKEKISNSMNKFLNRFYSDENENK